MVAMFCGCILLLQHTQGDMCDVCTAASPPDIAALARHGKGVVCDPLCLENEEGEALYCNALGLVSLFGEHCDAVVSPEVGFVYTSCSVF